MGARHFTDLAAWQLAARLRDEVVAFTATPPANRDFGFCNQIRDASASAAANIAEGFTRFSHADFARFLVIARSSLSETQNHLLDAQGRGYLPEARFVELSTLAKRALAATTRLLTYLRREPTPK